MCSGPRKPSTPPLPAATAKESAVMAALLLELAAADDLVAFRRAVEDDKVSTLDAACQWYGPSAAAAAAAGGARLRLEVRTPAMVAALYGSTGVLAYVLSAAPAEAARTSPTDGATPLHLAAAGGAAGAVAATHLLLAAGASADALAFSGLRAGDLLPRANAAAERDRALRVLLKSPAASPSSSPKKSASPPPAVPEPRKEYPPDLTLPDLKSGLFSTDEFRMYSFKVKPCSRAYSHDWTECPFVHPGENARRRDPRRYSYSCVPCPEFRKGGACRKGDNCEYAHGVFECWLHPAQYRTRLCKDEVGCARRICFFAHKHEELRSVNPSAVSVGMQPAVSSPRSSPPNGLDMGGMLNAAAWPSSPASRLKTALAGRELDFDLELLALDQYQQKLFDKVSSPRASWGSTGGIGSPLPAATPASAVPDYTDLHGSVDPGHAVPAARAVAEAGRRHAGVQLHAGRAAAHADLAHGGRQHRFRARPLHGQGHHELPRLGRNLCFRNFAGCARCGVWDWNTLRVLCSCRCKTGKLCECSVATAAHVRWILLFLEHLISSGPLALRQCKTNLTLPFLQLTQHSSQQWDPNLVLRFQSFTCRLAA